MIIKIEPEKIIFNKGIQRLCKKPYRDHPNGCINYKKKEGCPPGQPLINKVFDFEKNLYVVYTLATIGQFADRMRHAHPDWSDRQCYNPRLWQPTARKAHDEEIERILAEHEGLAVNKSPEAHGVNVTETMGNIDIKLNWDWPPAHSIQNISYLVSMAGTPLR